MFARGLAWLTPVQKELTLEVVSGGKLGKGGMDEVKGSKQVLFSPSCFYSFVCPSHVLVKKWVWDVDDEWHEGLGPLRYKARCTTHTNLPDWKATNGYEFRSAWYGSVLWNRCDHPCLRDRFSEFISSTKDIVGLVPPEDPLRDPLQLARSRSRLRVLPAEGRDEEGRVVRNHNNHIVTQPAKSRRFTDVFVFQSAARLEVGEEPPSADQGRERGEDGTYGGVESDGRRAAAGYPYPRSHSPPSGYRATRRKKNNIIHILLLCFPTNYCFPRIYIASETVGTVLHFEAPELQRAEEEAVYYTPFIV